MNILFGTRNLSVKYLQIFLNEFYSNVVPVTGVYDYQTHKYMVDYMSMYNVQTPGVLQKRLKEEYPDLFRLFYFHFDVDRFKFISKEINLETKQCLEEVEKTIERFIETLGWRLVNLTNYSNSNTKEYLLELTYKPSKNRFPNRDLLCMVNLFSGQYYYRLAFQSDYGVDNVVHSNGNYKLSISSCEPNYTYTISHGYNEPTTLIVGCSQFTEKQLIKKSKTVDNAESFVIHPGECATYTTNDSAKTLLIQLQNNAIITSDETKYLDVSVKRGDVNLDGKVDERDRELLSKYVKSRARLSGPTFLACCVLDQKDNIGRRYFDNKDLAYLDRYLNKDPSVPELGPPHHYYKEITKADTDTNKLLIISGDYSDKKYHVPFNKFASSPWIVHDKLLNYIFDIAITPYSDKDEIVYVQKMFKELNEDYLYKAGTYDDTLRDMVQEYQDFNNFDFSLGYVDTETDANLITELYNNRIFINDYSYTGDDINWNK